MSSSRRLSRVVPVGILSLMFIFGTQYANADTYRWQSAANGNWSLATNWYNENSASTALVAPGAGDAVKFTTAALGTVSIDAAVTVASVFIGTDQTFEMPFVLTIGVLTLDSGADMIIDASAFAASFTISTSASLSTSSSIFKTGVRSVGLSLDGTLAMGTLDKNTYIGPGIYTTIGIGNTNFITTDVVFMGTLDINGQDIPLGTNNLYLGPDPGGVIEGAQDNVTLSNGTGSIVTLDGFCDLPTGKICKGYTNASLTYNTTGRYNLYPLKTPTLTRVTHLVLKVDPECTPANSIDESVIPFAHISVRLVYNPSGGNGGHPGADPTNPSVLFHWPLDHVGMPDVTWTTIPDPNDPTKIIWVPSSSSGTAIAGYMAFHNNYRNGSVELFSAIWKPHLETNCVNGQLVDPFIRETAGFWDLFGSLFSPITTGSYRAIAFGKYAGDMGYPAPAYFDSTSKNCMYAFGDLSCGSGAGQQIPVELTTFSAHYKEGSVRLNWQTATELNNHGFYIERSVDGQLWDEIDFVPGAGNSNVPIDYQYDDIMTAKLQQLPRIAYRLRQEDRDGTVDYSGIVYAYTGLTPDRIELYEAYPNPFNPSTVLSYYLEEDSEVHLRVYNMLGREVAQLVDERREAGFHSIEFNGEGLPSGMYMAVLSSNGVVQQKKLVLNK